MKTELISVTVSRLALVAGGVLCVALLVSTVVMARQAESFRRELEARDVEVATLKSAGTATNDGDANREIRLLRQMLESKEKAYNALLASTKRDETAVSTNATVTAGTGGSSVAGPDRSGRGTSDGGGEGSWLERLRTEDPERYERIQREREERRQRFESRMAEQYARLDQRLQNAQGKEEADLVTALADTLNQMNEMRTKWESMREVPEGERQEQFASLIQQSRLLYETYTTLRDQDRQFQLRQLASQVGYQNQADATQFVEAINTIYRETDTSMRGIMGFGFGPGGGGGRRGGQGE
jgi:hypothetical protein